MWLFLWILFVLAVVGAFVWSYYAVYEQKRAWAAFAKKYNLEYMKGAMFKPSAVTGRLKDHRINVYAQENVNEQTGTRTTYSVVEVFLKNVPETYAVVTSKGFVDFLTQLNWPAPFIVEHKSWPASALARTFDNERPDEWFEAQKNRMIAMKTLLELPFDTAFVADGEQAFLAVRTAHPLSDPRRINQILGKLFEVSALLEGDNSPLPTNKD